MKYNVIFSSDFGMVSSRVVLVKLYSYGAKTCGSKGILSLQPKAHKGDQSANPSFYTYDSSINLPQSPSA